MRPIFLFLMVFHCGHLLAQDGPGGVGNTTTTVVWLRADAGTSTTTNGAAVSTWTDQSTNANNASQGTANRQPTYVSSFSNGMPALLFDNDQTNYDYLTITDNATLDGSSGFSAFAVYNMNAGTAITAPRAIFSKRLNPGSQNAYGWFFYNDGSPATGIRNYLDIETTNNRLETATNYATGTNYISSFVFQDGASPATDEVRVFNTATQVANGTESSGAIGNYASNLHIGVLFGHTGAGANSSRFNGYIGEIIIWEKALNAAELLIVNNYLSAKYNIAISPSTGDLYAGDDAANGDFDWNVCGIGTSASGSNTAFSTVVGMGMGMTQVSGFVSGDYIIAGHAFTTNAQIGTDVAGITGSNPARWQRIWYYDITNTDASSPVVDLNFDLSDGGVGTVVPGAPSDYVLVYRATNSGAWTEVATANSVAGDRIGFTGVTLSADGYYTIATHNSIASPLPISLLNFEAVPDGNQVQLSWATASELNNARFTIERSSTGVDFIAIAEVAGAGNSSSRLDYFEIDRDPLPGVSYYRLRQTDFDGNYSYSAVVVVKREQCSVQAYPNPVDAGDPLFLSLSGFGDEEVLVVLRDITGKEFHSKIYVVQDHGQAIAVPTQFGIPPGTYLVVASSVNQLYSTKVIIR